MDYPSLSLAIGAEKPFRALVVADTHLLFSDGRDCKAKYDIAIRRYGEYVYSNIGRNVPYFLDALQFVQKHCDIMLHCGDLIDFYSPQNLEVAQKLLELAQVDYFMCAGNHEYTNYSGQHAETEPEIQEARAKVPLIFKNDINHGSRLINGINLVALYNGKYQFEESDLEFFDQQVAKGYPIILMIHNPFYTPGLEHRLFQIEGETKLHFTALSPEKQHLPRVSVAPPATPITLRFLERITHEPLLKAVLAGHVHCHANQCDELAPGILQIVVGGGYYGCGQVLEIS